MTLAGFPHSGIRASTPTCGSARLIAAHHALHRLLAPRHPPSALSSLTTNPSGRDFRPCGVETKVHLTRTRSRPPKVGLLIGAPWGARTLFLSVSLYCLPDEDITLSRFVIYSVVNAASRGPG